MNRKRIYARFTHPFRNLYHREHTTLDKQRLTLLLFCYLPVLVIGILANFLGITEPSGIFFKYTHSILCIPAIIFLWLYYKGKISIGLCLSAFTIIGQAVISVEMIYCSINATPYYVMLLMANTVLLTMNMFVSMAASMKTNTMILGIATLIIYIISSFLADDAVMKSFIVVFIIAFLFASMVGVWMSMSVSKIETENDRMKKREDEVLHILRLRRVEVRAFLSLASEKYSHDGTRVLLDRLSTKTRKNLLSNVENYMKTRDTDLDILRKVFPEFTPSELEICRLILQGKKLTDICQSLNKNESNINSQRANMRKKLELKPTDNLQKVLQQRLDKKKS